MYIIADSGSTKTAWCVIREDKEYEIYYTAGINPIHQHPENIRELLDQEFPVLKEKVECIYFYGAGCAFAEKNEVVRCALSAHFKTSEIFIESDLTGAARGLCGDVPGIVCILGTGSNSCFYDGEKITRNIPPLGYILGDEGSGTVLGKILLGNILKGIFTEEIRQCFFAEYPYSYAELIDRIYRQPLANRFMASLTCFIKRHIDSKEIEDMVLEAFRDFFRRNVLRYEETFSYPIYFTGSIAFHFRLQLEKLVAEFNLQTGEFLQTPMEGLMAYHNRKRENRSRREA